MLTTGSVDGGMSLSRTATAALCADGLAAAYPEPLSTVAVTEPFASSSLSSIVGTANVAVPLASTITCRTPVSPGAANEPFSATVTCTDRSATGAGDAVSVNEAPSPSVTAGPLEMLTTGFGGGGLSLSFTATVALFASGPAAAYPDPLSTVAVTEPFASCALSSVVGTANVAVPLAPTVTCRAPVSPGAANAPLSATVTFTDSSANGAGDAVSVNEASFPPSPAGRP